MTLDRRSAIRIGLGAGALPFLARSPVHALEPEQSAAAPEARVLARPLPLSAVRLTGGPLKHAQEMDARYLLELEPDRMLAFFRERAGLSRKAEPYGGWDGPGRNLTGHIAGHYLSAVSLMFAATGDARFRDRAEYIVSELAEVQARHGDGYLVALEGGRDAFGQLARGVVRSGSFDLNGEWSPWYTLHKTYAGLRDAYRFAGSRTALDVEIRFAGWAERVLSGLDDASVQAMLGTEFGGMNEVLVDLYVDTGDERWLDLSWKFEHRAFIEPLQRHQDNLPGKHGNTQIPKLIGSADRFACTGNAADLVAASFFWDRVVQHHSFATGGHGTDEYFGPPDRLSARVDGRTAETCDVYNMLKLTRLLFSFRPDAQYADFHERALFNHILSSMDPVDGRMCYMVPVGRGVTREYQNMTRSFTCCVGSGMESHALHGDGIYYEAGDTLWVNLYAPSTAEWAAGGVRMTVDTGFPEGDSATLQLDMDAPREFTLALRRPYWAGEGFQVRVNGLTFHPFDTDAAFADSRQTQRLYETTYPASTYLELRRTWRSGDRIEIALPKSLRLEAVPDDPHRAAILWGPLVLAGDLGPEPSRGNREADEDDPSAEPLAPVFVPGDRPLADWLVPAGSEPGRFRSANAGHEPDAAGAPRDVDFMPFYRLHRRTYSTYWDIYSPDEWDAQKAAWAEEDERMRQLEAATVTWVNPGVPDSEGAYNYRSENSVTHRIQGRQGRRGPGWFSYELPVDSEHALTLVLTHFTGDRRGLPASFEIRVDGELIAEPVVEREEPSRFIDLEYPIPAALVAGRQNVTVRFQAKPGSQVGTIFGVRVIRADARR